VSTRMADGNVLLTVAEAAALWREVGSVSMSDSTYRRLCKEGAIKARGIDVSGGPRFLTDMDSLLACFDREITLMRERLDVKLAERKVELEKARREFGGR